MTLGSARTSAGLPSEMRSPWSSTRTRSLIAHDHAHVVLDEQDGQAEVAAGVDR